jgi:hypothetical protein
MVNRKSKSANFLQNGSPKKRLLEINSKTKKVSKKVKKKRKIKTAITWKGEDEYNEIIKPSKSKTSLDYSQKIENYLNINLIGQKYEILNNYSVSFDVIKNLLKKDSIDVNENISIQDWDQISEYTINKIRLIESNKVKKAIL